MVPADSRWIARVPRYSGCRTPGRRLACKGLSPAAARLSRRFQFVSNTDPCGPTTPGMRRHNPGLGCSAFARHYLRNHSCFLFLRVLRCFSSPRSPPAIAAGWHRFTVPGCPIRKSRDQRVFAPTPGLSQLVTSFIASRSLGIHRLPCSRFSFFSIARRGTRPRARAVACLPAARHAPPPASSSSFQLVKDLSPPRPPFREGAGERPAGALPRAGAGSCRTAAPPPRRVEDKGLEPLASCVQGRRSEPTELIPRERSPRQS